MNAVIQYPGSKWRIAKWIISHFPKHHSYLEPFAGSLAVLFNKPLSNIETVNDLNLDVVNFFRCIREDSEKLAKIVEATPYSRSEYDGMFAAERLKQVQIECMPAVELIKRFRFPKVLIYADPPYLMETRTAHVKAQYSHEMLDEQSHVELLEVLLQHPGPVVISGYESELYKKMLEDRG